MSAGKILISEDDVAVAMMLAAVLEDQGYQVAVAFSQKQAVQLADRFQPDLVLIGNDGRGDFVHGWRTAGAFARQFPHVPLIMLSTATSTVAEARVTERGRYFAAGLRKPFQIALLLDLVRQLGPPHS
jgi:DNA-binding response OmpR family regulator